MIKKIYNYLFIVSLTIACCLGFSNSSKAAIVPPSASTNVDYSRIDYNDTISEYSLFNSFDYSYLDKINVDIHLTSSNLIETNIEPTATQVTTYSGNCFGNLCYQQQVKLLIVSMYYVYSGGTYRIYYFSANDTSAKSLNYSTTTCNTVTYVNNTVSTSNRSLYIAYTNNTYYQQAVNTLYTAYENSEDLMLGSGNSLSTAITNLESSWGGKLLYNTNTGLTNATTTKTSTCKSSSSTEYSCNSSLKETYYINLYDKRLGSFLINKGSIYSNNKCYIASIGTNIDNGYYYSYEFNFNNLTNIEKKEIWYKLTQINETSNDNLNTLEINRISTNGKVVSGIDINFRLELIFKTVVNYEYNNAYFKFNTNSSATLTNFYYGIFDLILSWSNNNTYTVALLNEKSTINSNNLILISNIDLESGPIIFDYNFNIALITDVLIDQILSYYDYRDCKWYQFMCHVDNFFTKAIYDIPILSSFYRLFENMYITIGNYINLFIEYKEITFIGSVIILSLVYHMIKKFTE